MAVQGRSAQARKGEKSAKAFRTISEVAADLDVPQHVLRFWESKFTQVRPLKRGGGRRYYRPEDIELLRGIRDLLYTEGYTIKGVQKLLREGRGKLPAVPPGAEVTEVRPTADGRIAAVREGKGLSTETRDELKSILGDLKKMRTNLRKAGG
jgi:DNA-binding transcriptional MerR regulator